MTERIREGEFQSAGKTVQYTDGTTLQLVLDLYQFLGHEYEGTPSMDSQRLEDIIGHLRAGAPLSGAEWDVLRDLKVRHGDDLQQWRDRGRDGENPALPAGTGRISESLVALDPSDRVRIREAVSASAPIELDRFITHAHLLDGALHDLAHAKLHTDRLADPKVRKDAKAVAFHHDHAAKHVDGSIDHVKRLRAQLEKHPSDPTIFRQEIPKLHKIREADPKPEGTEPISTHMQPRLPTICVDFDGVIHQGGHGLPGRVEGTLIDGAAAGLKHLAQRFRVVILTARVDLDAVRDWCKRMGISQYIDEITNRKPPASAYIDDRATHFTDWPSALKAVDPDVPIVEVPKMGSRVYHTDAGLRVKIKESHPSPPPNLREAPPHDEATETTGPNPVHECGSCKMFDNGRCWGYGNIRVDPDWVCDHWYPAPNWREQQTALHMGEVDPVTAYRMGDL